MKSESWMHAWGRSLGNEWEHVYPAHWAWPSLMPNRYDEGSDFFYVHWEVKRPDAANRVYLHVESPKAEMDPELNALKARLLSAITAADPAALATSFGLEFHVNPRATEQGVAGSKLTSAFSVVLPSTWLSDSAFSDMIRVHSAMGDLVESSLRTVSSQLDSRLGVNPLAAANQARRAGAVK